MESYPRINQVNALPNYRLLVTFQNGIVKEYDCTPLLEKAVFRPLREASLFNQVVVGGGGYGIVWNDDIDLSEAKLWLNGVTVENPVSEDTRPVNDIDLQTPKQRQIALVYRKTRISEQGSGDLEYWLSQPPSARLAALEEIRREVHGWKPGEEPRMEKVVTIIKRNEACSSTTGDDEE
jgi:hypothetical protein